MTDSMSAHTDAAMLGDVCLCSTQGWPTGKWTLLHHLERLPVGQPMSHTITRLVHSCDGSAGVLRDRCGAHYCNQHRSRRRLQRTSRDWEDGGHDKDSCDEDNPADSNPANHKADLAQVEGPWLEVLVVEEADSDRNGICM